MSAPESLRAGRREGNTELKRSLEAALADLASVMGGIARTAEAKCCERCPYMNVHRECTALFECLNQVHRPAGGRPLCSGQHRINFAKLPPVATGGASS